jgi:PPOX class probable F420-dependent enzyme
MASLNEKARELIDGKNFAFVATVDEDGPQVSPVWIDRDGDTIRINTARGRVKERNMRSNPQIGISVVDAGNPYAHVDIRGRVVGVVEEPEARAHIDGLNRKYNETEEDYPARPGEERVLFLIEPERVADRT